MPVVVGSLHSQVPGVAAAIRAAAPDARIAYVMTDGAALPIAISDLVDADDAAPGSSTSRSPPATPSAATSRRCRCRRRSPWPGTSPHADVAIVAMGPGVVGTSSPLGTTALEVAAVLDAAAALGGHAGRGAAHVRRRPATAPPGREPPLAHRARPRPLAGARRRAPTTAPSSTPATTCASSRDPTSPRCSPSSGSTSPRWAAGPTRTRSSSAPPPPPAPWPPRCSRSVGSARVGSEAGAPPQPDRAAARRAPPAHRPSEIQRQLEYPEDQAAFRRAFERDKDELRTMGIPLRVEQVPGVLPEVDGYRIPREEYALRDPGSPPRSWPRSTWPPRPCRWRASRPPRAS